jgi:hypothetical protein
MRLSGMKRGTWLVAALVSVGAVAGCTTSAGQPREVAAPQGEPFALSTFDWDRTAAEAALATGTLHERDGCLFISGRVALTWPNGFSATRLSDGTVVVYNYDGVEVARSDQQMAAGGGFGASRGVRCADGHGAFYIQDDMTPRAFSTP